MMLGLCWLLCSPQSGRQGTPPPHVACREARARATYYCQGKNVRSCYQERGSERVRDRTEPKRGGRGKRRPAVHERASAWSNFTGASRAKRARADGVMNGARAPRRPGARRGGGLEKRHLYLVTAQRRLGWTRPRMETAACGRTHMRMFAHSAGAVGASCHVIVTSRPAAKITPTNQAGLQAVGSCYQYYCANYSLVFVLPSIGAAVFGASKG